jgi:hypothetical protein
VPVRKTSLVLAALVWPPTAAAQGAPYDAPLPAARTEAPLPLPDPVAVVPVEAPAASTPLVIPLVPALPSDPGAEPWWLRREPRRRPPQPRSVFFQLEGGPTYGRLDGFSTWGGEVSPGADFELPSVSVVVSADFRYARLDGLVGALQVGVGATLAFRAGVVRVGGSLGLGLLSLSSVTADPAALSTTLDAALILSVDVDQWGPTDMNAVYLGAKLRASVIVANDAQPVLWGPAVVLGARL